MEERKGRGIVVKIVLAVALVALVALAVLALIPRGAHEEERSQPPEEQVDTWRCFACARVKGKAWKTCKTIMGRGSEEAAIALIKERVCSEAQSENECDIGQIKCKKLDAAAEVRPAVKIGDND